jgi:hypothetical protein
VGRLPLDPNQCASFIELFNLCSSLRTFISRMFYSPGCRFAFHGVSPTMSRARSVAAAHGLSLSCRTKRWSSKRGIPYTFQYGPTCGSAMYAVAEKHSRLSNNREILCASSYRCRLTQSEGGVKPPKREREGKGKGRPRAM